MNKIELLENILIAVVMGVISYYIWTRKDKEDDV
jgi:preprotein translocase subunit YajC